MAVSKTLTGVPWPTGTSVSLYSNTILHAGQTGAPTGAAITSATVSSTGTLTYPALTKDTSYVVGAQISGAWIYLQFDTYGQVDSVVNTATFDTGAPPKGGLTVGSTTLYEQGGILYEAGSALTRATDLAAHEADSTAVHGIADTSLLDTIAARAAALTTHEADSTAVHGITNTADLALRSRNSINVKDYGAVGDGVADDIAAIQAAYAAAPARGGHLYFPAGIYRTTATLDISKQMRLEGAGGTFWDSQSTIKPAAGVTGIKVWGPVGAGPGSGQRGGGTVIEALGLEAAGKTTTAYGVEVMGPGVVLRDMWVRGFATRGVWIHGDTSTAGNANMWRVYNLLVEQSGGNNFHVEGLDSNAGVAVALWSDSAGGWGLYDDSFLGNTYIQPHAAGNGQTSGPATTLSAGIGTTELVLSLVSVTGLPASGVVLCGTEFIAYQGISGSTLTGCLRGFGGSLSAAHSSGAAVTEKRGAFFVKGGGANSSTFVGRYTEPGGLPGGQGAPDFLGPSSASFGQSPNDLPDNVAGAFLRSDGNSSVWRSSALKVLTGDGKNSSNFVQVGYPSPTEKIAAWIQDSVEGHYRFNWGGSALNFAYQGVTAAIQLTGATHSRGGGEVIFPQGAHLGGTTATDTRRQQLGTGVPTTGTWTQGDILWNKSPTIAVGIAGWICVAGGTPGTWGKIPVTA